MAKSRIHKLLMELPGHPSEFDLNARIFNSVCLISILGLAYNIPFNYFIGLPKIALISFIVLILISGLYYASRILHKVSSSIFIANVVCLALFTLNYFLNSGINGPNDLFFLLILLLNIALSPPAQYKFWVIINLTFLLALHLLEYYFPDFIPYTYSNRFNHFADQTSAYIVVAVIVYFCTVFIRSSYESEKLSALEKSKSIEEKNLQILKQNQELERLNAEKNKLMSIIAHDLRAPLGNIQHYLELLTEFELDEQEKSSIETDLLNSTKETMGMLSKLLAWSKSQLHGVVAYPTYLNLNQLLENTLHSEKEIAARKGIELNYYFDHNLVIYADADMMQLIVRNFIGNAIKFTSNGGNISLAAEILDNSCLISIKDTGIGISADQKDALFSLKAQSTYGTKGEKGIGLGLLLCFEYITAQNGKIWFESSNQSGTCFYISIPFHESKVFLPA